MSQQTDHWLMQYGILRLVKQCQRLIQAEFGVRPALSDPDLRNQLADYAGRSRSRSLQALYGEVRLALIELEGPDRLLTLPPETPERAQRMYRGQPLETSAPVTSAKTDTPRPVTATKTIIYRGKTLQVA